MKTLIILILMILMSGIASADTLIVPYGTRNLPPDDSYVHFDFENYGGENLALLPYDLYNGLILLPNMVVSEQEMEWSRLSKFGRGIHVYPHDHYWDDFNNTNVPYIYIIEGGAAMCPRTLFGWQYFPGSHGTIEFPEGATHVSFLLSTGGTWTGRSYDKRGNLIESIRTGGNTERVTLPDGPSQWTLVTFNTGTIHSLSFIGGVNSWHIDDLLVGGLPLPEAPTDYLYAVERMKQLIGAQHGEGLGYNLILGEFYTSEEIINDALPYWDPEVKEVKQGIGITGPAAILYAFNGDLDIINWGDIDNMAKHDFDIEVEYGSHKPGDVFFIDYPDEETGMPDGHYDEIGIVIEPQYDPETGMLEDIIRIIPDAGVHYGSSEFINVLYGDSGFVDYRRLPENPKGGHSPYPKVPSKYRI